MLWNGIPFITEKDYAFGEARNLLLYLCVGTVYIASALTAGVVQRSLDRWWSPRTILAVVLCAQALICLLPAVARGEWVIWTITVVFSATSALLWPIVESYLSAGRHGNAMRTAMGWWNVAWMGAVAVPLWLMAPLMNTSPRWAIVGLGVFLLLAACALRWFRTHPAVHNVELSQQHTTDEYPHLLRSARITLALSYVLLAALSPLLPFLLSRLEILDTWQTPSAATWMLARVAVVAVMWKITFWHGRWGTLLLGGAVLILGFILIITAHTLPVLLLGLTLLGGAMGIVYYAALYYAMSVGAAAVDAGGRHEALIGLGYAMGPAAGLAALFLSHDGSAAVLEISFHPLLIVFICVLTILGALLAAMPYRKARLRRRSADITQR